MAIVEFKSDSEYQDWIKNNSNCFVVNTTKKHPRKFVLHTSICHHITSYISLAPGVFTERNHDKFGSSDINKLKEFFKEKGFPKFEGEFTICKSCNPHQ